MLFKKAVLLIHGFAGGIYDFGTLANEIQLNTNYDVFTFTLPGHDKSRINNVTKEDWIKACEKEIENLINHGYKKIIVIGHSMGGVLASYIASKYKEVKKLILAAPAFRYFTFKDDKFDLIDSIKNSPKILKDYSLDTVISRIFKVPVKTAIEFTKLVKEKEKELANINCPTLIIHGLSDEIAPKESTNYVHNKINSKVNILVEIKDVNHDIFTKKRNEEIIELIIKFIKNNYIEQKRIIKM